MNMFGSIPISNTHTYTHHFAQNKTKMATFSRVQFVGGIV